MTPVNELELAGIVRSPSGVFLIMSCAEKVRVGEHIAVPFEGRSRSGKVGECTFYRDRYLLWVELEEGARQPVGAQRTAFEWPVPWPVRVS